MSSATIGIRSRRHDDASDRALVALTRDGDDAAYAELWARHRGAAIAAARRITSTIDAEDLVSEAYAGILATIRRGGGPVGDEFRPYLCATVRNLARRWGSRRREIAVDELPEDIGDDVVVEDQLGSLDQQLVREAFLSLPDRWREVLWHLEVEELPPETVARRLGLTRNATAVLAFRAREGLRRNWLQAHVAAALGEGECAWVRRRLGEHSRDGLGKRAAGRVDAHLAQCRPCRDIALEVGQANRHLARMLVPALLGAAPVGAWLAAPTTPAVAAALGSGWAALGTIAAARSLAVLARVGGI